MSDPEILLHFRKNESQVNSSAFSTDGRYLATAGTDAFIHLFPTFSTMDPQFCAKSKLYNLTVELGTGLIGPI